MRSIGKLLIGIILCTVFFRAPAFACKPILLGRNDSTEQLVSRTKSIVLAKVKSVKPSKKTGFEGKDTYDYQMMVVTTLKGSKKLSEFSLKGFEGPDSESLERGPGLDCMNHGGFKEGVEYLIFRDSVNPKAYLPVSGADDPWLAEIKGIVQATASEKSK